MGTAGTPQHSACLRGTRPPPPPPPRASTLTLVPNTAWAPSAANMRLYEHVAKAGQAATDLLSIRDDPAAILKNPMAEADDTPTLHMAPIPEELVDRCPFAGPLHVGLAGALLLRLGGWGGEGRA